jgi:hypothetical protein
MAKKGGSTQRVTTGLDPQSNLYVNQMRNHARDASQQIGGLNFATGPQQLTPGQMAEPFMNPYMSQVIDATRGEYDHMRGQALTSANQQATQAGAFGGSRHGIMAGARLGEIDRAQGSQIAGMLQGGYQSALGMGMQHAESQRMLQLQQQLEPYLRMQAQQQMLSGGMGPTGNVTSTQGAGPNRAGMAAGGAMAGFSALGPWGALAGAGVGLLGGSF